MKIDWFYAWLPHTQWALNWGSYLVLKSTVNERFGGSSEAPCISLVSQIQQIANIKPDACLLYYGPLAFMRNR